MQIGSGIIPFTYINNSTYFLFGLDRNTNQYSDFGGRCENKLDMNKISCAFRECNEETFGLFEEFMNTHRIVMNITALYYTSYVLYVNYNPNLILFYNKIMHYYHKQKQSNEKNVLFEKKSLNLFTVADIKRKFQQFRDFFKIEILPTLIAVYDNNP
jgi:hypothetical protein